MNRAPIFLFGWFHIHLVDKQISWRRNEVATFVWHFYHRGSTTDIVTHWGRMTHMWVSKLTFIGSDNGLSRGRRQALIWTNDGIFFIGTPGTNFSENLIAIHIFSLKKMHLNMSFERWRPVCLGHNALIFAVYVPHMASRFRCTRNLVSPAG